MDYYQRLFNTVRPMVNKRSGLPNFEEVKNLLESEWSKNYMLGVNAYQQKNYQSAVSYLDKAIQENQSQSFLYYTRANIKEDSGDASGAIADYKKSLELSGNDWYTTYNQIAINFLNKKDFTDALKAFDIAIELKANLKDKGINENLLPYLQDGVVLRVDSEKMYTNRANVKLSLRDFQGCYNDCVKAIELNPEYANSYFILGLLYLTIEQTENAYKALKIAEAKGHNMATNVINRFFNA
jgi:tetratricopeptide (TPR) repeat protein